MKIVAGDWNDAFIDELEAFDGSRRVKDDQVDAAADAFQCSPLASQSLHSHYQIQHPHHDLILLN